MIFGSVCSGIEAASVAWESLGWSAAWLSEIEKFPCEVLEYHYPITPNLGDMTKLHENKIFQESKIDLLVGGTPCQSFSVAGLRKGLSDPRGNLCLEFLRLVDIKRPRWVLWENVPGVLSSYTGPEPPSDLEAGREWRSTETSDFGRFLSALSELGYGFSYRVLDAQYFGVPQRRRRIFVVGYLGDWRPAAAVLFESESLRGNIKAGRKTKKAVAALTSTGVGTCGADDNQAQAGHLIQTFDRQSTGKYGTDTVDATVSARDYKSASDLICFSSKDSGADASDIAPTLRAGGHTTSHANAGVMPAVCITGEKTHALKADGFDGSEDGTGRGQSIVACGVSLRGREGGGTAEITEGAAPALRASSGGGDKPHVMVTYGHAVETTGYQGDKVVGDGDVFPSLPSQGGNNGGIPGTLLHTKSCVRRLTPRECERLQGFPDDYTLIPVGKKMAADGPRYKALGNSMAVPCMRWIGERIQLVENVLKGKI